MKRVPLSAAVGTLLALLGGTVMLGWWLQLPLLVHVLPGFTPMVFNTALCFVLAGGALINHVLDLSRVEAGRMDFSPEIFRAQKAIDEVCAIVNPLARKKSIRISVPIGSISLEREPGKGSTFTVVLPRLIGASRAIAVEVTA